MRIQIIEDGYVSHIYGSALKIGFHNLGHEVLVTQWSKEVRDKLYCRSSGLLGGLSIVALKIQNKFRFGRYLKEIQQKIINDYLEFRPDLVFIYRGTHVCPRTIDFMKVDGCASVFGYNNDDPFSSDYSFYFWRSYKKCLSLYDHVFCYRKKNISDYASIGISNTSILKPYYVADYNYFIESIVPNHKIYDVVFIGHFEDDGRDEAILKLCREGFVVKLFGTDWERSSNYPELYEYMGSVEPIFDDYNVVLNRSKIALAFLSKKNNDTYTRRNFEIPATGTLMLSEYTPELASMYTPGVEADFFTDKDELVTKVELYLSDDLLRERVGKAGLKRVTESGAEVTDRCREILSRITVDHN